MCMCVCVCVCLNPQIVIHFYDHLAIMGSFFLLLCHISLYWSLSKFFFFNFVTMNKEF